MGQYPVTLEMQGRTAVVIGGGKVAERKVQGLLKGEAGITVVSPEVTEKLDEWARTGRIVWKKKLFDPEDIKEAFLIIAATDDREANRAAAGSVSVHQLLNVADDPLRSSFQVPSILRRGKLSIAVSTSGASPKLAKKIRDEIGQIYDDTYEEYLDFLMECRTRIVREVSAAPVKEALLAEILKPEWKNAENRSEEFEKLYERTIENIDIDRN